MGKAARRAEARKRQDLEDLRKKTGMLPFFVIFGAAWLIFGLSMGGSSLLRGDGAGVLPGGVVAFLGAALLVRAFFLRRKVLQELARVKGTEP